MSNAGTYSVPAKAVAVTSSLLALGSLATLVVVSSVKQVDVLSTIALALAILAFVVQLIVYIVQASSASQQLADARTLHGQMMSVLTELQTRSAGTQKSIDLLQEQMFTELRAKAGYGPQVSAMESASVLSREVEDESEADEFPEPLPESVRNAIHEELLSWPSDEDASEIDSLAKNRGQDFMMGLWGMAVDALRSTEPDTIYGPGLQIDSDRDIIGSLISAGYAEQIPGTGVAVLTPQGRRIGRIFTAQGPPPDWVPEQVMAMRRAFEAVREMSRVTRDTRRQNSS